MPKVSIVVVNYNYARYLDERIQTFLNQTYKDFELIIIDNGSTDNSVEIINKYTDDPRIEVKLYYENDLPFKRWNDAIELTRGEYLLIAASDDSCQPTLLEKLVETLDKNPSVGLAYTQSWDVDDQGNRLRSWKEWTDDMSEDRWSQDYIASGMDECQYLLFRCTIPNPSGVLMRRKTFFNAEKFDTQFRLLVDWLMWIKMLLISDIAFIAEPLNNYRTHPNSLSKATASAVELEERIQVISYLAEHVKAPQENWEGVFNQAVGDWANLIINKGLPLRVSQKFYAGLKELDPHLNNRLLRHLVKGFIHKLSLPFKVS